MEYCIYIVSETGHRHEFTWDEEGLADMFDVLYEAFIRNYLTKFEFKDMCENIADITAEGEDRIELALKRARDNWKG